MVHTDPQTPDPREERLVGWVRTTLRELRSRLRSMAIEAASLREENQRLLDLLDGRAAAREADTYLMHDSGKRIPLGIGAEIEFGGTLTVRFSGDGKTVEAGRYGSRVLVVEADKAVQIRPVDSGTVVIVGT